MVNGTDPARVYAVESDCASQSVTGSPLRYPMRASLRRFGLRSHVSLMLAVTERRKYSRRSVTANMSDTWVLSPNLLNEARIGYLNGDPVTLWEAQSLSTAYTRAGSVPFTIGQSRLTNVHSRQAQLSDTLSWSRGKQTLRLGGNVARHTSGGTGSEPGTAVLGTFTFLSPTTAPFDQLQLSDVQNYTQPISFGISSYELNQWLSAVFVQDSIRVNNDLTLDAGLRYDRQSLSDATNNFAPRVGFGWHPKRGAKSFVASL